MHQSTFQSDAITSDQEELENYELPFISKKKMRALTPLEQLIIVPASDSSRYKNLIVEDSVRTKIFGKMQTHSIEVLVRAGEASYPHILSK